MYAQIVNESLMRNRVLHSLKICPYQLLTNCERERGNFAVENPEGMLLTQ